jgi:hypothetical protein
MAQTDTERVKYTAWIGDLSSQLAICNKIEWVLSQWYPRTHSELEISTWITISALDLAVSTMQRQFISAVLRVLKHGGRFNYNPGTVTLGLAAVTITKC